MTFNTHELKTWPESFNPVYRGEQPFEVRRNDRDFRVGDKLILWEYIPEERWIEQYQGDGYTGSGIVVKVTYILDDPRFVKEGFVILGIKPWEE